MWALAALRLAKRFPGVVLCLALFTALAIGKSWYDHRLTIRVLQQAHVATLLHRADSLQRVADALDTAATHSRVRAASAIQHTTRAIQHADTARAVFRSLPDTAAKATVQEVAETAIVADSTALANCVDATLHLQALTVTQGQEISTLRSLSRVKDTVIVTVRQWAPSSAHRTLRLATWAGSVVAAFYLGWRLR